MELKIVGTPSASGSERRCHANQSHERTAVTDSRTLLHEMVVAKPVKFPAFYRTRNFITAFTRAKCRPCLNPVYFSPLNSQLLSLRSVLILF